VPTQEQCTQLSVKQAQHEARIEAISERLDELLEEVKGLRKWLSTYGTVVLIIAILGERAVPIVTKIFGAS
jgi:hypothetical protein